MEVTDLAGKAGMLFTFDVDEPVSVSGCSRP